MSRKDSPKPSRGFNSRRPRPMHKTNRRATFEPLESRQLLAVTLPAIGAQTVLASAPLNLALHSTGTTNSVTYSVSVNNSNVTASVPTGNTFVKLHVTGTDTTNNAIEGDMIFELFNDLAPKTAQNFIDLINESPSFYNGLIFHRVMAGFMMQGGDPDGTGQGGPDYQFDDEYNVNLQFTSKGLLAMANSGDDTNGSQFFITDASTRWLDFNHSIFGLLVQGDSIRDALTNDIAVDGNSRPTKPVTITSATIYQDTADAVLRLSAPLGGTGTSTVTVTATDSVTHETSVQSFQVTVAADTSNNAPFLGAMKAIETPIGTPISVNIQATDVEGNPIYYDASVETGGAKLGLTVDHSTGAVTLTPAADLPPGVYSIKVRVAANASDFNTEGAVTDSQLIPVYVTPLAPTSVTLLAGSDTGASNSDHVTNLNNTSGKALQFQVSGLTSGNTVRLYSDGTLIGEAVASGTSFVITTNGSVKLTDGSHTITAKQVIPSQAVHVGNLSTTTDLTSPAASTPLTVAAALQLDFTPITTATPDAEYVCLATATSATTVTYELTQAPSGMDIDADTGVITWTPTAEQLASTQNVTVKATDLAGNVAQKSYSIALNTAPVLTRAGDPSVALGPIVGLTTTSLPFEISLSSIINNGTGTTKVVDPDNGAIIGGIAVTQVAAVYDSATNKFLGSWSYSIDGKTTFHDILSSSPNGDIASQALLLPKDAWLRYTPSGTAAGTAVIAFRAWDMSSGAVGDLVDLSQASSSTGGSTAFSADGDNVQIAVNDAPVLTAAHPSLGSVNEDSSVEFTFNAAFLKTLINGAAGSTTTTITDPNKSPYAGGIAITGLTGDGTWEYMAAGTSSYVAASIDPSHALLLSAGTAKLKYTPKANSNSPATLTYVGWDKSAKKSGDVVDLSQSSYTGGATAFSTASDTTTLTVTPINDAPVLTPGTPAPVVIGRTTGTPAVTAKLSDFINASHGSQISDADATDPVGGIAITSFAGGGTWKYSLDGALFNSIDVATISTTTALLLPKDAWLQYTPGTDNTVTAEITYLAWDKSSGTAGTTADTTTKGGTAAFSTDSDSAVILVNNAPVLTPITPHNLPETDQNTPKTFTLASIVGTSITDSDTDAVVGGVAITHIVGHGKWSYALHDGGLFTEITAVSESAALLLPKDAVLRYTPDNQNGETASITYRAWDTTSGVAAGTFDLSATGAVGGASAFSNITDTASLLVTDVNDAPVLAAAHPALGVANHATPLVKNLTDFINKGAATAGLKTGITDADSDAVVGGIAIVGITGAGTWEYSIDGAPYAAITAVSESAALLLPATAKLRYTPTSAASQESPTITYHAWDTTFGDAEQTIDLTGVNATGGTTAFSIATDTASLIVNDAPILAVAGPSLGTTPFDQAKTFYLTDIINNGPATAGVKTGITDPNTNAQVGGIALVAIAGNGRWEYSLNGSTFTTITEASAAKALLLPASAVLRYTPAHTNNTAPSITYRAWDTTVGAAGQQFDVSGANATGGFTAFSVNSDTATLTVRDAPTDITLSANSIGENVPVGTAIGNFTTIGVTGVTYTCTLVSGAVDNAAFTIVGDTLKTAITYNAAVKSTYSIRVRTVDELGVSLEKTFTITILDKTAPTVTINQQVGQADPAHSGAVIFSVVFSEPVTDFTIADVVLTGTTAAGAKVAKVTKSTNDGTKYEVQVSGMTGSGVIIANIPAGKAHDAAGNGNAESTHTDNSVQYTVNWATYGGTGKDDTFLVSPGPTPGTWQVLVNSTIWSVPAGTQGITLDGFAGNDSVRVVGTSNVDSVQVFPDRIVLGGNFEVDFTHVESLSYALGDLSCIVAPGVSTANSTIYLFGNAGSAGAKTLAASPTSATLSTGGYTMTAQNFANVQTYVEWRQDNTATFTDSSGNELLLLSPIGADLKQKGGGYEVSAWGFGNVNATAIGGTSDEVRFYGKSGAKDTFAATPSNATYTNSAFVNKASNFDDVQAYIDPNNDSTVTLTGTNGNDRAVTSPLGVQLFSTGFQSSAWNFKHVNVLSAGGTDSADMYGYFVGETGAAKNFFAADGQSASQTGGTATSTFNNALSGFQIVRMHGNAATTDSATLDNATFNANDPAQFNSKVVLDALDELFVTTNKQNPTAHAVDQIMKAYW
jgi:cyclophilin family peptidyl-prolyl cis-trans isomerase